MSGYVDEVAVERACQGDRTVRLNEAEVAAAVRLCERRGLTASQTGDLLGMNARTVLHVRQGGETVRRAKLDTARPVVRPAEVTFLTVQEVAHALRVSKMTIYRLCHSGELESKRVGRSFRIPGRALADFLRASDGAA